MLLGLTIPVDELPESDGREEQQDQGRSHGHDTLLEQEREVETTTAARDIWTERIIYPLGASESRFVHV